MIPADPRPRFDIFSHLPDTLKIHTLSFITVTSPYIVSMDGMLEKMTQVSRNYLYGILRLPNMDHSNKQWIYFKALRRIEENCPHLSNSRKSMYCLRAVRELLSKARYYVNSNPNSVDVTTHTYLQRINLAETISHCRQGVLIDFFKELVMQLPFVANQLSISEDQSRKDQVNEIRALLPTIQKEIVEVGDQLAFVSDTLYPVEACPLFPLFDDLQKRSFLQDLINLGQYEPIEKILAEYGATPVHGLPAALQMVHLCCSYNVDPKLLQKIISSIESAAKKEESEEPINNASYLDWLQKCVNTCAKNSGVELLKILFTFDGIEQLDVRKILNSIFEKNKQVKEKLEFLRNSPIQIHVNHIQFMVKELIEQDHLPALKEVLKFRAASELNIEEIGAILDEYLAHYTSPIIMQKIVGFEEFEFIIKKFPEAKELLKQKIDIRLEELNVLKDPQLRYDLEKLSKMLNLESEAVDFLAPPPAASKENGL